MKKIIFLALCFLVGAFGVNAQEAPVFAAEDFANQSEVVTQDGRGAQRCQAVRILPKWYLTAAHCVVPYCDRDCMLTFTLLPGALYATAQVYHTSSQPRVFVPRQYHKGDPKNIRYDVALVRFDPQEQEYFFYDRRNKKALDKESFLKMLRLSSYSEERSRWEGLLSSRPRLIVMPDADTRHLRRPLAVPQLRADGIFFHESKNADFYYFKELHHFMGSNFGVERGMSGSGVVMPGGDVIGVVSASLSSQSRLVTYDEEDRPVSSVPYSAEYFLFTPISQINMSFIKATILSFHESGQSPRFSYAGAKDGERSAEKVQTAFPGALTVKDVVTAKLEK